MHLKNSCHKILVNFDEIKSRQQFWTKLQICLSTQLICTGLEFIRGRVLSTGGRGEAFPPQKKKFYWKKKITAISNKDLFLTTILRNQWRLLISRNAISANPEHYIFKIFRGSMPPDPPEKIFSRRLMAQKFFQDRLPPPPKQKILDRTLRGVSSHTKIV